MTEWPPSDDDLDDDERTDGSSLTRRLMGLGADVVQRALVTGVSAVFMTEEGIRAVVSDLRLPKDVARGLIQQADATKNEMFRIIGREVRTFLEESNMSQAISRALADTTVEIRTTIRFRPNDEGGITPEVVSDATVIEPPPPTASNTETSEEDAEVIE